MNIPTGDDVLARLSAAVDAWESQAASAHLRLAERIASLQGDAEPTVAVSDGHAPDLAELRAELERARTDLGALREAVNVLQSERGALLEALNALQSECAQLRSQNTALEAALQDAQTRTDTAQRETESLRLQCAELAARLQEETARGRESELESALSAAHEKIESLKHALEQSQAGQRLQAIQPEPLSSESTGPSPLFHAAASVFDGQGHKRRMGEILVEQGILSRGQLDDVMDEQRRDPHRRFGKIVVDRGFTTEEVVAKILAAQLRLRYVALDPAIIDSLAVALIPPHIAAVHRCMPVCMEDERLVLAMANPLDLIAIEDVELTSRRRVEPVVAVPAAIDAMIARFYPEG